MLCLFWYAANVMDRLFVFKNCYLDFTTPHFESNQGSSETSLTSA